MAERTTFVIGMVCCILNVSGWITTIMSEENKKQYWVGLAMLTISVFILAGMVIAEMG